MTLTAGILSVTLRNPRGYRHVIPTIFHNFKFLNSQTSKKTYTDIIVRVDIKVKTCRILPDKIQVFEI